MGRGRASSSLRQRFQVHSVCRQLNPLLQAHENGGVAWQEKAEAVLVHVWNPCMTLEAEAGGWPWWGSVSPTYGRQDGGGGSINGGNKSEPECQDHKHGCCLIF